MSGIPCDANAPYMPTPAQVIKARDQIKAAWTDAQRTARTADPTMLYQPAVVPVAEDPELHIYSNRKPRPIPL